MDELADESFPDVRDCVCSWMVFNRFLERDSRMGSLRKLP